MIIVHQSLATELFEDALVSHERRDVHGLIILIKARRVERVSDLKSQGVYMSTLAPAAHLGYPRRSMLSVEYSMPVRAAKVTVAFDVADIALR